MSAIVPPTSTEVLVPADEIAAMPWHAVRSEPGIHERSLWSGDGQVSGVMRFAPGASMAEHVHDDHGHHVWVVEGTIAVNGRRLGPGSYAHVPPGVAHEVAAGPDGCMLFYVFTTT